MDDFPSTDFDYGLRGLLHTPKDRWPISYQCIGLGLRR
jgi:hypothetical protein